MNTNQGNSDFEETKVSEFSPTSGPLSDVNRGFHQTYERLISQSFDELGDSLPVIVLLGDDANLLVDKTVRTEPFIPSFYHDLKSLCHVPFDLQLLASGVAGERIDQIAVLELEEKKIQIRAAYKALAQLPLEAQLPSRQLLELSQAFVERLLSEKELSDGRLAEFLSGVVPLLRTNFGLAVRLELDRLHEIICEWREDLRETLWQQTYVVICARHQPRYRHAARQYFGRLFGESEGKAAEEEERIIYAEGMQDIDSAKVLLARHIVDQKASQALFGDKRRLQQDLLADFASRHLDTLLPIERSE